MAYKPMISIPTKKSMNELRDILDKVSGGTELFLAVKRWFSENPKKTMLHIENMNVKIRRYPGEQYTLEEV